MSDDNATVLYAVDGGVVRITLNRPDKRNALSDELIGALKDALRRADQDESVRVVVLAGAGSDFCSGADLTALQKISKASVTENLEDARSLMELFLLIREVSVPVVAAVHGRALAGGCGLATACDIVLAASSARFGYPEIKIGFVPAMVMAILRRNVSEKRAFELVTLGTEIGAPEAVQIGLVNRLFKEDCFESEVDTYVRAFEKLNRAAVALTKRLLYQMDGMAFAEAIETGADLNVISRMTQGCREGVARFLARGSSIVPKVGPNP
jgi:methylglutaconyl-CoA hydratase